MPEIIQFHKHLKNVLVVGQAASPIVISPEPTPNEDLAEIEKNAYERGRIEAKKELQEEITAARALLGGLLTQLQKAEEDLASSVEAALPELVIEGLRRVIPSWTPKALDVQEMIREMLIGLGDESGKLEIYLNEQDKSYLDELEIATRSEFNAFSLMVDPCLRPGECFVAGRFGMVDGRFESKLNGLRKDIS
jgi:flagellar biosynthesis/type III secretory pathway protein FliH